MLWLICLGHLSTTITNFTVEQSTMLGVYLLLPRVNIVSFFAADEVNKTMVF